MKARILGIFAAAALLVTATAHSADLDKAAADAFLQQAADNAAVAHARELADDPATPMIGDAHGDVAIIEFFDYQCPYCKAAEPRLEQLVKQDGHIKLVLKDFPILTPESRIAARAALASRLQGKYQAFHEALIGFRGRLTADKIFEIAHDVGLDIDRLRKDMDSPEIADHIISDMNLARALKISVTPAFIVDTKVLSGVSADTATSKIVFPDEVAAARARKGKS